MYLQPGETYSVRELMEGLLLASGNDAALLLARGISGSEAAFVEKMNQKARELGLQDTHFANPHGLDAPEHYSTAADLAGIMLCCMQSPDFQALVSCRSATIKGLCFENHNRLLDRCPGCLGGKTGYTQAAGRCLVSCCEREGTRFVCVTLDDPRDWEDHCRLYDWAFSHYQLRSVSDGLRFYVPLASGKGEMLPVEPEKLALFLPRDATVTLEAELPWFIFPPVKAGSQAGLLRASLAGEEIGCVPIRFIESSTVDITENGIAWKNVYRN